MLAESNQPKEFAPSTFGFYSVMEIESIGFCGGYLVLNEIGRPLEFHCTLPVKPGRSQEILFGDSLRNFLIGEHIGPPLIGKAKNKADLILVNQPEALLLEKQVAGTVALITVSEPDETIGVQTVDPHMESKIRSVLEQSAFQLLEPFERITTAIDEAQAATRQESR